MSSDAIALSSFLFCVDILPVRHMCRIWDNLWMMSSNSPYGIANSIFFIWKARRELYGHFATVASTRHLKTGVRSQRA